jgi:predicted NBD/HSP70 family sugar kinase
MHMLSLGIDIGGSSVKAAALNENRALWTYRSESYNRPDAAALTRSIASAASGGDVTGLTAVGLCVPGLLDSTGQRVTLGANIPSLVGIPLARLVQDALGVTLPRPPHIVSDAHAAAHDIATRRALAGRVAVLSLGTGVGMSVLDDGVPLVVDATTPGHIGQIDVSLDSDPPVGPDGGAGGLEAYIGAPALERAYGNVPAGLAVMTVSDPPIRALVRAIRIVHAIYRPRHVVLAGGVGLGLRRLLPEIQSSVNARLTSIARDGWALTAADHEFHAACGAAALAMHAAAKD